MFSEPTRRKAMEQARDNGNAAMSGMVTLVQETEKDIQKGFLVYLPFYRSNGQVETVDERRSALKGFVFSPFRINDLMRGILGNDQREISFELFDGDAPSRETLLYDNDKEAHFDFGDVKNKPEFSSTTQITLGGHVWTLYLHAREGYVTASETSQPLIVAFGGVTIDLLLFMVIATISRQQKQAKKLAVAITKELRIQAQAMESAPVGISVIDAIDPLMPVIFANQAYLSITGYSIEEVLGRESRCLDGPEKDTPGLKAIRQAVREGRSACALLLNIRKDGRVFWNEFSLSPVYGENGEITHFLGIANDVTTRMDTEGELAVARERTQSILDNVHDGIITIDEIGTVKSLNSSATRIFGFSAEEVIGRNVKMLMPEPYHSAHDGYLHNYMTTGTAKIIGIGREVMGKRKDGELFPMDLAVTEVRLAGQRIFIGLVRDITDRKRIERMQREFVSTVSHELRTPLTSIRGALGLISGGALGPLSTQAKQLVDIANKNSERLTNLINDLLDMDKIVNGKMEFNFHVQPLVPLVEQAIEANHGYGDQYHVKFKLVKADSTAIAKVDDQRLIQVLANLLSNAAKFSPAGSQVDILVTTEDNLARISVIDHGEGISEEFQKRIFQKFSQADSSDTRSKGGTGLGLAISKEFVEQMGGKIGFHVEPSKGTTFFVELPLASMGNSAKDSSHDEQHGIL
jgi:PAS domain S-box-containing protein